MTASEQPTVLIISYNRYLFLLILSFQEDEVKNLSDPVMIEFKMTNKSFAKNCSCVFWDFEANGGLGQWSRNGCAYEIIGDGRARCNCSHLTHFGILVVRTHSTTIWPERPLI